MKTLTVSEALIALGNGEKVTSDYMADELKGSKYIHVGLNGIVNYDGENSMCENSLGRILYGKNLRIYEEFTYPMWFKDTGENSQLLRYDGIDFGECLESKYHKEGNFEGWAKHTSLSDDWQQREEPKKMIKVALFAVFKKNWYQTTEYYKNEESCLANHTYATLAKRLDYTEIEVEDY